MRTTAAPARLRSVAPALLALAAIAAVISLGLPWASALELRYQPPIYSPGLCSTVYDPDGWASVECDPIYSYAGYTYGLSGHHVGYQRAVRVLLPAAVLLLIAGVRLRRRPLVVAGYVAAAAGLVVGGLRFYPGQVAYVIALVAITFWLVRDGWLRHAEPSS